MIKVLMLGWEYPPSITGGLGVASQGIAEGLASQKVEVTFLLPKKTKQQVSQKVQLIDVSALSDDPKIWLEEKKEERIIKETTIGEVLVPYLPPHFFSKTTERKETTITLTKKEETALLNTIELKGDYENNLLGQTSKYAYLACQYAKNHSFDVIHAHDWPTFLAAKTLKATLKVPFVAHMHSTEFERNGIHAQEATIKLEKEGLKAADHIVTVSQRTKQVIVSQYEVAENRISVVPNAIEIRKSVRQKRVPKKIGFVGRFTDQKSPATFIDLARDLKSQGKHFEYIMIGDGYLLPDLKAKAEKMNLNIRFTGFLDRQKLLRQLNTIDLIVVPSHAEPFGLVTLEAIMKGIPVAAARGSGIGEFIPSLPQVDKWNHFDYASMIIKLMTDIDYRENVINKCQEEASELSWGKSAQALLSTYSCLMEP